MLINKKYKTTFWYFLLPLCVVLICWVVGFMFFCGKIYGYSIDEYHKTDAVVVLTGGRNRIAESIRLLNNNLANRLFISGVSENVSIKDIEDKAKIYIDNPELVELGYKARDTVGNAREVKEWTEKNNINSVRLVTSNYHLPRSMLELYALNTKFVILPHPVYSDHLSKKWFMSWGTFKFTASEYNKFLLAWMRNLF